MRYDKVVTGSMAVAGMIAAVAAYLVTLKAFVPVYYLAAAVLLSAMLAVAYAVLHLRGRLQTRVGWARVVLVLLSVFVGYPLCVNLVERVSLTLGNWTPTLPSDVRVFIALFIPGLLLAGIAWVVTCIFVVRLDGRLLLLFVAASTLACTAGSVASGYAARRFAFGPLPLVYLLFPGLLYLIGMTGFAAVFGHALAGSKAGEREESAVKGAAGGA